jgi:hypothetical protein
MFYGSAYAGPLGNLGDIQVARSTSIGGTYQTYTTDKQWVTAPTNPMVIIRPVLITDSATTYGAGQPSVVVYNGMLRMFYNDTTTARGPDTGVQMLLGSTDPTTWNYSAASATNAPAAGQDIKYDPTSNQFTMYMIAPGAAGLPSAGQNLLMTSSSLDGINWQAPVLADVRTPWMNYNANNVGASGDQYGQVIPGSAVFLAFGAPYSLEDFLPAVSQAQWDLYGEFTQTGTIP